MEVNTLQTYRVMTKLHTKCLSLLVTSFTF